MKKQEKEKKALKLHKETVRRLSQGDLQAVLGGAPSNDSCFPDICIELDSSNC